MFKPPFLRSGDSVGIIAPASHISQEQWASAVPMIESWGLEVTRGKSLSLCDGTFAGNDAQRLDDLVSMMTNPKIKAIFCARGGYGCSRLLPHLENHLSTLGKKWLIGYSDITVLASFVVNRLQTCCIHGAMAIDLSGGQTPEKQISWETLRNMLFGKKPLYSLPAHNLNRFGNASGTIAGGNLSVIYSLNATPYQWKTRGCILFIEDVGEKLYHIDRMMTNLRIGGQLANLKGLIVGAMNAMADSEPSFGKTAYEIIAEHVKEYKYPVAFGFPAGHDGVNYPLMLGAKASMNVSEENFSLSTD